MLKLPGVTLCAVDCLTPSLAAEALRHSSREIDFGEILLISDVPQPTPVRQVLIEPLNSRAAYSRFVLERLVEYVSTPYVLLIQWDGFVIHPRRWEDGFTKADYIGAWWGWFQDEFNMGNGGFSLRSRRLLECVARRLTTRSADAVGQQNEDLVICRELRPALETIDGLVFASAAVARAFSYERNAPEQPTFGFHGLFNFWRHVDDSRVIDMLPTMPDLLVRGSEYCELMLIYLQQKKFTLFEAMFARAVMTEAPEQIQGRIDKLIRDPLAAMQIVAFGSRLLAL